MNISLTFKVSIFLFNSFSDQLILCAQCILVIFSPYSLVHIHPRSPHHIYCPPSRPPPPALFIHSFMYLFIVTTESSWSCPYAREHDWCCRIPYFDVNTGRPGSSHCLFLQQMFTVLFVFPPLKINCYQKFLSLCFSFKFLIENVFLVIFCWWFSLSHLLDFPHPPYPSNSMSLSLSL